MHVTELSFLPGGDDAPGAPPAPSVPTEALPRLFDRWIRDGADNGHSPETGKLRRVIADRLLWFLEDRGHASCGNDEVRDFFAHLRTAHPGGRWGDHRFTKAARPQTLHTYHSYLRTFFNYLVLERRLHASPMARIKAPRLDGDQVQPFSEKELEALFDAAGRSRHPTRDRAILCLLLDTGIRASELCGITYGDLDLNNNAVTVTGKGNKTRRVYFSATTYGALWDCVWEDASAKPSQRDFKRTGRLPQGARVPLKSDDPLFRSDRGRGSGMALTRSGLLQLVERLGATAGITGARCTPHTFRHTFAVTFLRNGGNVFTLQQILGHSSLKVTHRYVALAEADIEYQQRRYSPVEALRGSRKGRR
jgi:site-specific recombinase XerD